METIVTCYYTLLNVVRSQKILYDTIIIMIDNNDVNVTFIMVIKALLPIFHLTFPMLNYISNEGT